MTWQVSRYTHALPLDDGGGLLYNGRTGAIIELSREIYGPTCHLLDVFRRGGKPRMSPRRREILDNLVLGGFLIQSGIDELKLLEEQYEFARRRSQFLLTILPTFGCNLGCDYCFVGKKHGMMSRETQEQTILFVEKRLRAGAVPSMHVDWFGGEPLLALPVIESLSEAFVRLCNKHQVPYRAQVITNGTVITERAVDVLQAARVDRLQITLDGPAVVHDERRPYKSGKRSSFSAILDSLPLVVGKFLIRLRINVDGRNLDKVWPLLDLFGEQGWLGPDTNFFPYLARLSPFTDACSGLASIVCSMDDFYLTQFRWMEELEKWGVPVSEQGLYQFPEPRLYNCGAVGANGFVFTPEGEIHKCGLEVDDSRRAIGRLGQELDPSGENLRRFQDYSPFRNPVCRDCEFLPTCLGGCPRNQIEHRQVQIKENCTYHKQFEHQLLLFHLGHRRKAGGGEDIRPAQAPMAAPASSSYFPILR